MPNLLIHTKVAEITYRNLLLQNKVFLSYEKDDDMLEKDVIKAKRENRHQMLQLTIS